MGRQLQAVELTHHESRMQQKNIENPVEAFELYFSDFSVPSTRKLLWELYQRWVMSERATNCDPSLPAKLVFFYSHLEMLIEAAWMVRDEKRKVQKKKR